MHVGLKKYLGQTPNPFSPYLNFHLTQVTHEILTMLLFISVYSPSLSTAPFPLLAFLTDHLEGIIMEVLLLL